MARSTAQKVLQRQLVARKKLWPEITDAMLWSWKTKTGFIPIPRAMPLIMSIMDDLSGKGFPVGQTYLEMWSRLYDELFLTLNRPEEMAFHAGFSGQRALRTWKDRVRRLRNLGFIDVKVGPLGELSYAVFLNPYHVIKRAYLQKQVQEAKWQALMIRTNDIGAFDLDDIDDSGQLTEEVPEEKVAGGIRIRQSRRAKTKT